MTPFQVEVHCQGGGVAHTHTLLIEPGESQVYGVSMPVKVRLQYTCPLTHEPFIASFTPPPGAARPFNITKVT